MSVLTIIYRVLEPVFLTETMEENVPEEQLLKTRAKQLLKSLEPKATKVHLDDGKYYFCYSIVNGVCYLTVCEKSYPRALAFSFLDELQKEFDIQHGADVLTARRPYAFQHFGTLPISSIQPQLTIAIRKIYRKNKKNLL
jgi:vesicle transport protein SEC22